MGAPTPDDDLPVLLLKAFTRPTVEDMHLPCSSVPDLVVVCALMTCWKSCEGTFDFRPKLVWQYRNRPLLGV